MGNIRRSRGYSFEHGLVEKLNRTANWQARRLGGSSTGLPDIVATNNTQGILLAIECKSTQSNTVYVPPDQILRCVEVCNMFQYYKERHVIFAVKFMRTSNRKLRYYFKRADMVMMVCRSGLEMPTFRIDYNDRIFSIHNGKTEEVDYILNYEDFRHLVKSIK